MSVAFKQVDVFTTMAFRGNPLAVIMDAEGLTDDQMAAIARWTNLSETTFVLPPESSAADYRIRIFTPSGELPFAGHPTLGTAHALLEAGWPRKNAGCIVQECGVGLVEVRIAADGALAFAAPTATLTPFSDALMSRALNSEAFDLTQSPAVADMGIRWLLIPLSSEQAVTDVTASVADLQQRPPRAAQGQTRSYRARQGSAIQRNGRIDVTYTEEAIWIGGQTVTVIDGTIAL